jgi:hypothetical protein
MICKFTNCSVSGVHAMTDESKSSLPPGGQFLVYQTEDGKLEIDVRFESETVWLTQQHMAELFQTTKQNVSLHIRNIFSERELREDSVVKESLTTAADGKNYATKFYNLDVIISVGYRVKSLRGTQFRIWATQRLREYIVKGFTMDDERLNNEAEIRGLTRRRGGRGDEKSVSRQARRSPRLGVNHPPTRIACGG